MTIYVSNVGCHVSSAVLYRLFAATDNVASAGIISHRETGKSLRYGFVDMVDEKSVTEIILHLQGKLTDDRGISIAKSEVADREAIAVPVRVKAGYESPPVKKTCLNSCLPFVITA